MTRIEFKTKALTLLTLLISLSTQNPSCLVDQCKHCRHPETDLCDECEDGYYRKIFYGADKGRDYHACWSTLKLIWGIIGFILLLLSYCVCFYLAWRHGNDSVKTIKGGENEDVSITERPESTDRRHFKDRDSPRVMRRKNVVVKRNPPVYAHDMHDKAVDASPSPRSHHSRYYSPERGAVRHLPR